VDVMHFESNADESFYDMLGPFLSRREIVKELGFPVWDDDDKSWLVAIDPNHGPVGFVAWRPQGDHCVLCSAWTHPDHRRRGVYSTLFDARLAYVGDKKPLRATCTDASRPVLESHGFEPIRKRGRYTVMERAPQ